MDIRKNITKFYAYTFFREFVIILPIFVLFYQENGLNMGQVGFLAAAAAITGLILEIPTGVFADIYGRRNSIVIGILLVVLGFIVRAASTTFLHFALALAVLMIGKSFISGADDALLYDSLKDMGQVQRYKEVVGMRNFIYAVAMGLAAFVGGYLSVYGLRTVHYLAVIPIIISLAVSLTFKEPKRHKKALGAKYFSHLWEGIRFSFTHKKVRSLILFSGFMIGLMLISHLYTQPYMKELGIAVPNFGAIYLVFLLFSGVSSKIAHIIEERLGERFSIILIPVVLSLQLFLMSMFSAKWAFLFIFLGQFTWGFSNPIINHYINQHVESYHRATVNSIDAMMNQIVQIVFAPVIGFFADIWTLKTALFIQGGIVAVIAIVIIASWRIKSLSAAHR